MQPISVSIIICSRKRPVLLKRALDSLTKLIVPETVTLSFVVIENDDTPQYGPLIDSFKGQMAISHVVEPIAGLTYARNSALDVAIESRVDWMGNVDDDQSIDKNWLVHMAKAIRTYPDTAMFVGRWLRTSLPNTPPWYPEINIPKTSKTGTKLTDGVGGNVMIRADVMAPEGMGLRYDHEFRFMGGEDTDFSLNYKSKGGIIRHVREAETTEEIPVERNSLKGRLERVAWARTMLAKLNHRYRALPIALLMNFQVFYQGAVLGIANIAIAFFALPFAENWALRRYGTGRLFLARARGIVRFYLGKSAGEPYRNTLGS